MDRENSGQDAVNRAAVYHAEPFFRFLSVTLLCRQLGTMRPSTRTKQLTMRISEQDRARLQAAAAGLEITVTDMVKTALTTTYGVKLTV